MRKFLILSLFSGIGFSQVYFTATKQTSLSGAAEVVTVQQAVAGTKDLIFSTGYFDCSVACTMTIERTGTPAANTALTTRKVNPGITIASTAVAFSSSDVGTGTVIGLINCAAACAMTIDLSKIKIPAANSQHNITFRSSSITGTISIIIAWGEIQQ